MTAERLQMPGDERVGQALAAGLRGIITVT